MRIANQEYKDEIRRLIKSYTVNTIKFKSNCIKDNEIARIYKGGEEYYNIYWTWHDGNGYKENSVTHLTGLDVIEYMDGGNIYEKITEVNK